jgi:3-deoxy-D-manno-octulosonic-acid transferase
MAHPFYTAAYALVLPLALARQWWRGRAEPAYRQDPLARFGRVDGLPEGALWIHAVSAGETIAATPLVRRLRASDPSRPVLLTTTTATGRAAAEALAADDPGIAVSWLPWDLPAAVGAFLARTRPRALVIMETELWPNLLAGCARAGVPVMLANARLSVRSARGYGRVGRLTRRMLGRIACLACQDAVTASRFEDLGADPARTVVTGSVKFDLELPADLAERVAAARERLGAGRTLVVAASTHEDEEARLVEAFGPLLDVRPDLRLVIVPRHPNRFDAVLATLRSSGRPVARWSEGPAPEAAQLVLVDAMGVLLAVYGVAAVAFVGGSLVARGGHNPIEAAVHGVPVVTGPAVFNFEAIVAAFRDAGALVKADSAAAVAARVDAWLDDPAAASAAGAAGRAVVEAGRGALGETLVRIEALAG